MTGRWDVFAWIDALLEASSAGRIRPSTVAVALALQRYATYGTPFGARPTVLTLATKTGLGESAVRQALRSLEDAGLIVTVKRGGGAGESARGTEYALTRNSDTPVTEMGNSDTNSDINSDTNSDTLVNPTENTEDTETTQEVLGTRAADDQRAERQFTSRDQAVMVACPRCGATSGSNCTDRGAGSPRAAYHQERHDAAIAAGAKPLDLAPRQGGGTYGNTNADHWANGGQFSASPDSPPVQERPGMADTHRDHWLAGGAFSAADETVAARSAT